MTSELQGGSATPQDARRPLLASSMRRRILDALLAVQDESDALTDLRRGVGPAGRHGLSAPELAETFDLHVTTVRHHLDALEAAGVVVGFAEQRRSVGRPRKLYAVQRRAIPPGRDTASFQSLSELVSGLWRAESPDVLAAESAAQAWARAELAREGVAPLVTGLPVTVGAFLDTVVRLESKLEAWGFVGRIHLVDGGRQIDLDAVECPFRAIARSHPDLVAAVYRGLVAGTLATLGLHEAMIDAAPPLEDRPGSVRITAALDPDVWIGVRSLR